LVSNQPLFPGDSEIDQLRKIFTVCGSPTKAMAPSFMKAPQMSKFQMEHYTGQSLQHVLGTSDKMALDLLSRMLQYEPTRRISAINALSHPYFKSDDTQFKNSNA